MINDDHNIQIGLRKNVSEKNGPFMGLIKVCIIY